MSIFSPPYSCQYTRSSIGQSFRMAQLSSKPGDCVRISRLPSCEHIQKCLICDPIKYMSCQPFSSSRDRDLDRAGYEAVCRMAAALFITDKGAATYRVKVDLLTLQAYDSWRNFLDLLCNKRAATSMTLVTVPATQCC